MSSPCSSCSCATTTRCSRRSQILSHVWGYTAEPGTNVVNVYVSALRKKLGGDFVESVRGVGYRMRGDLDSVVDAPEPDPAP